MANLMDFLKNKDKIHLKEDEEEAPSLPVHVSNESRDFITNDPDGVLAQITAASKGPSLSSFPLEVEPVMSPHSDLFDRVSNRYAKKEQGITEAPQYDAPEPEEKDAQQEQSPASKKSTPAPKKQAEAPAANVAPKDYMQDLLSKIYGKGLGDEDLQNAQDQRNQTQLFMNLSKAGNLVGEGLSRGTIKANNEIQDSILKNADQPIQDIQTRRAAKMQSIETGIKVADLMDNEKLRDPASEISGAYRNMALQLNPKLSQQPDFNSMSAQGIKQLLPMVDMSIKMDMMKVEKQKARQLKEETDTNKRFGTLAKTLTSELSGNRTSFGKAANTYASAEKLQKLVEGRDLNDLDNREVAEIARSLDGILSSGQPTVSGMKKLIPDTAMANAEKLTEYLLNERKGARLGNFLDQMMHTVEREKDLANEQIQRGQKRILAGYSDLKTKNPDRWNELLTENNLPIDGKVSKINKPLGGGSNKVKVSNGKETFMIDPSDVENALKDGFKKVN
jgi:hypothetical protein